MDAIRRRPRRAGSGFTLIEVLLVVTVVGILSAIAIPSLDRARGAAYEASTIGSLHALHSGQALFSVACGGGFYAPSIPWLATLPVGTTKPFIGPEFTTDADVRQNYTIRFTLGTVAATAPATCNGLAAGQTVSTYFVGADLLQLAFGMSRYFGVNSGGTIYQSTVRVPVTLIGSPPAPATPIK
jgi:prepilin-type N-terminal cleavage/methylation domain-containing protein